MVQYDGLPRVDLCPTCFQVGGMVPICNDPRTGYKGSGRASSSIRLMGSTRLECRLPMHGAQMTVRHGGFGCRAHTSGLPVHALEPRPPGSPSSTSITASHHAVAARLTVCCEARYSMCTPRALYVYSSCSPTISQYAGVNEGGADGTCNRGERAGPLSWAQLAQLAGSRVKWSRSCRSRR